MSCDLAEIFKKAYAAAAEIEYAKGDMVYTKTGIYMITEDSPSGAEEVRVRQAIGGQKSVEKVIPKIVLQY